MMALAGNAEVDVQGIKRLLTSAISSFLGWLIRQRSNAAAHFSAANRWLSVSSTTDQLNKCSTVLSHSNCRALFECRGALIQSKKCKWWVRRLAEAGKKSPQKIT